MDVTHVQQIKAAIGGDQFLSSGTQLFGALCELIQIDDFCVHDLLTTKSNA
jgi:hypothetical protein